LSSITEFDEQQLAAARAKAWCQDGNALLTAEATREWLGNFGLVLFAPRPLQLPSPAPSLVEATLGTPSGGPTAEQVETAMGVVGRLVAEGTVLPLNLMGVVGETPDFVVSAQVFSYIFTLRGDKAWKLPPATSGAVKVSPLGLRAYEVLTEHPSLTAAQIAAEMGREASETATLRVLTELWSQLRVIPVAQPGDAPALWELTTRRFTKSIKAGANAGQPKALSALISLYLAQAIAATEEEITTFLSPLTARSRLREVLHALTSARQLETVAVEGKTLLHIAGALAGFAGAVPELAGADAGTAESGDAATDAPATFARPKKIGTGRISSFKAERKPSAEFRGKPARSFSAGAKPSFGARAKPSFGAGARPARDGGKPASRFPARADGKSDRERRPFRKAESPGKPSFTKPWDEGSKPRPAAPVQRDGFTKYRKPAGEDRVPLGPREQAGLPPEKRTAPKASFDRGSKPGGFSKRPYAPRAGEGGERATFKPRSYERGTGERKTGERTTGERGTGERGAGERGTRPGGFGVKSFGSKNFAARAGSKPGGFGAKRPYTPRPAGEAARGPFKPRTFERGAKPDGFAAKRPYSPRTDEGAARTEGGGRSLPKRPYKPRAADADQRIYTKAPWVPKTESGEGAAKRPYAPRKTAGGYDRAGAGPHKSFGAKSGPPKFGAKRFGAKKFGAKPGGAKPTVRKKPEE